MPQSQPDTSSGLLSLVRVPTTFEFVSLNSAEGYLELLKFVHNDIVDIPNKRRKIVADLSIVNEGEYYVLTLNWQNFPQRFATASAFIFDKDDGDGCEIRGYGELTNAIPLFGLLLFVIAVGIAILTSSGIIPILIAFVLYVMATRGALRWRDALVRHLFHLAQIMPDVGLTEISQEEFDERIDLLVKGIKQGA